MLYINPRYEQLWEKPRESLYQNPNSFVESVHPDDVDFVLQQLVDKRYVETGFADYEYRIVPPDGNIRWVRARTFPIKDDDGTILRRAGIVEDITRQKRYEETLQRALEQEKELSELKSRFVSMASHEFRTPLATILALTETLSAYRHKLPDDQIEERLDKIRLQIGHLKDIMEDVLLLARMQARRVEFNPVKLDLDALCRSVLDEFRSRADVKHRLEYTASEGVHEVKLDRKLMRQIISNLVSNAIKYSPEDKAVNVNLEYIDSAVTLVVRDEGIGIPEADLKHLFEPFHRAANVGDISGTGLGMVITKESVELHGGTITVESQIGIGTLFTVSIPLGAEEEKGHDKNPDH
jgi:PAS domain S-box-containing protein